MNEKDLRQQILIPLLKAMKYQDVREYHGTTEFGKDIVCWELNKLKNRHNLALVVKATAISGNSLSCADVTSQVCQCFGDTYNDLITGSKVWVNECWVVSNKLISHDAIDHIVKDIGRSVYAGDVNFIGIDKLWKLVEEYMPLQAAREKLEDVQRAYETLDTHYGVVTQLSGTGIHQTLVEKFPGAAQEKPLAFHINFEFPKTDEGKAQMEALERFRATGAPVKIPGTFIKNLEYPGILKQIYPPMTPDGFLEFSLLRHPEPVFLRCDIQSDDGEQCAIEYIHLICTQAGQEEITLTNEDQPIPFKVQLIIRKGRPDIDIQIHMAHNAPLNVHQQLFQMRLRSCLSKPYSMRFTHLETGQLVCSATSQTGWGETPNDDFIDALQALDKLQMKTGKLIHIPERNLNDEEYQDIAMLRSLFHTGKLGANWNTASAAAIITDDTRAKIRQDLSRLAGDEGFYCFQYEEILTLFGEVYPLGPIKEVSLPMRLANWEEIKAQIDEGFCGKVQLKFIPRDDGRFVKEYVQWLPEPEN